jgi:hypothetical protein
MLTAPMATAHGAPCSYSATGEHLRSQPTVTATGNINGCTYMPATIPRSAHGYHYGSVTPTAVPLITVITDGRHQVVSLGTNQSDELIGQSSHATSRQMCSAAAAIAAPPLTRVVADLGRHHGRNTEIGASALLRGGMGPQLPRCRQ